MRYVSAALFILFLTFSQATFAQEASPHHESVIPAAATIFVLDDQGKEHLGKFLRLDDRELIMVIDGQERTFERNLIKRIERDGDSVKNGAQIGAVVGFALGLLKALTVTDMRHIPISMGLYSLIGMGVDSAHEGRTTVYQRDSSPPVRQQGTSALTFSVRW